MHDVKFWFFWLWRCSFINTPWNFISIAPDKEMRKLERSLPQHWISTQASLNKNKPLNFISRNFFALPRRSGSNELYWEVRLGTLFLSAHHLHLEIVYIKNMFCQYNMYICSYPYIVQHQSLLHTFTVHYLQDNEIQSCSLRVWQKTLHCSSLPLWVHSMKNTVCNPDAGEVAPRLKCRVCTLLSACLPRLELSLTQASNWEAAHHNALSTWSSLLRGHFDAQCHWNSEWPTLCKKEIWIPK